MDTQWFYGRAGQQFGPVGLRQLQSLANTGALAASDLVWNSTLPNWIEASSVPEIWQGAIPMAPMPVSPGNVGVLNYLTPMPSAVAYAGFWLRFVAAFLDGIICTVISAVIGFILGMIAFAVFGPSGASTQEIQTVGEGLVNLVGVVINWLYFTLQESSAAQVTLGKRAVGIKVTGLDGGRISFGRATGRYFSKILSVLTLCIGYILAGVTERKQALHDMIASTLVVVK